jgi:HPt (histidine-containing phosphotransfer) domain-containing protein
MKPKPHRVHVHPELQGIAPDFLARARLRATEMREALDAGELERVARTAHQLYGAGTSFGMPFVTHVCREIERLVKSSDVDATRERIRALVDYLAGVELT